MNEDLIRIFSNQASDYAEGLELNRGALTPELLKARDLKFAELIVKECARIDSEANNPDHVDGETYNQTILQHFGVEE